MSSCKRYYDDNDHFVSPSLTLILVTIILIMVGQIKPSGSNSDCEDDLTCPAPMYIKNGVYVGEYSNNVDVAEPSTDNDNFGLDDYEPEFFLDAVAWNQEDYSIALKFDVDDFTQDIFYFCHVSL